MTDDDHVRRWLVDDPLVLNAVLVVAATSFTVALTSCLWHHICPSVDHQLSDSPPSVISTAFASLHLLVARAAPSATQQQSLSVSDPASEQKDHKSTRSKERRRRGKDPFRDLLKGGKMSKALLKTIKDSPPSAVDTLSNSSTPQNDTASSTSRSQSPEPAGTLLNMDHPSLLLHVESDNSSARNTTPNGSTPSTSAVTSAADIPDHSISDPDSHVDTICTCTVPTDLMTAADVDVDIRSASTATAHSSEDVPSSPSISTARADSSTPQPRDSQVAYMSGSCAKLVRARTRLRLSRMDPNVKLSLLSSTPPPLPGSVTGPINSVRSFAPCPSLYATPSTSHSPDRAGPSTPTNSRGSTPPPRPTSTSEHQEQRKPVAQPLDEDAVRMQLASMRSALEAACLREEQLRAEAERASRERDELRWRWNEDAGVWSRREAELQAQIHHLMQQLQAYAAVASFQAQQASSAFSSPTSPRLQHHPLASFPLPPAIQTQNSASAPAHVQALLASAPMLTSHPPGFAAPSYPGPGFGMSPLLWSGLGLCVPNRDARHAGRRTPDSSASGSSSRGRRRRRCAVNARSASDESSLGEWDGMEDGSADEGPWEEEEEDIFRNNALADAILKRPESIRGLSSGGKRSGGIGERIDALKDPALESGFAPPLATIPAVGS